MEFLFIAWSLKLLRRVLGKYEVNPHTKSKIPIPGVKSGGIAPWFGQPGGGTQHLMPMSIEDLLKGGFIEPIG